MEVLKAGFGKANLGLTKEDVPIRNFEAIFTDLNTRVALFGNENEIKFVIASIPLTSITNRDINIFKNKIKRIVGIKTDKIWISALHTFSAPHLKHVIDTVEDNETYNRYLNQILCSLESALKRASIDYQLVRIGYRTSTCNLNINRNVKTKKGYWLGRNFHGYSDHQVRIVCFIKKDDTYNLIFNYDIQPSVMDHIMNDENKKVITGDLLDIGATKVEEDQKNIVIPLIGCAGDQSPIFKGKKKYSFIQNTTLLFEEAEILAQSIEQSKLSFINNEVCLENFIIPIDLPCQVRQKGTFEITPTTKYKFETSKKIAIAHLYGLSFGKILLLGTEPELNSKFGRKCRQKLKASNVLITTLINGAMKYLPEKDDFENITYQSMNTSIGKTADSKTINAIKKVNKILERVKKC